MEDWSVRRTGLCGGLVCAEDWFGSRGSDPMTVPRTVVSRGLHGVCF